MMKKKPVLDQAEEELIAEYERGAFKPVKNQTMARKEAMEAAQRYMRKDARINIRLSTADLDLLKQRAAEEGLPYQSLIASILQDTSAALRHRQIGQAASWTCGSRIESDFAMHNTRSNPTHTNRALQELKAGTFQGAAVLTM